MTDPSAAPNTDQVLARRIRASSAGSVRGSCVSNRLAHIAIEKEQLSMTRRLSASARWILALVLAFTLASPIIGAAPSGYSKGSSKAASSRSGSQKTVHVKGYTKKDGTKVAAHDRK